MFDRKANSPTKVHAFFSVFLISMIVLLATWPSQNGLLFCSRRDVAPHADVSTASCDLFTGRWIDLQKESGPALAQFGSNPPYNTSACPRWIMNPHWDCIGNGRPDREYLRLRWKPDRCYLPRLDDVAVLEALRGKTIGCIGDSLCQNMIQSMGCIWHALDSDVGAPGPHEAFHWYVTTPKFNVTVGACFSQYLGESEQEEEAFLRRNLTKADPIERLVHVDRLDPLLAKCLPFFDAVVFSTGQWWLSKPKQYMLMDQPANLTMRMALDSVLRTLVNFVHTSDWKGVPILRTVTPAHFFGGRWNMGGGCPQTSPLTEAERDLHESEDTKNLQVFLSETSIVSPDPLFRIMDTFRLMNFRADGHPAKYNKPSHERDENDPWDCVHWCMPGPGDVWTQFLYAMLLREPSFKKFAVVEY